MIFIIALLFLISFPNESLCLRTSDLCQISSDLNESKLRCLDAHKYRCSPHFCAVNKLACNELNNLKIYFETARNEEKKVLKQLFQAIKKCARNEYTWQASDVCLSSFTCYTKNALVMHRQSKVIVSVKKPAYCPCTSESQEYVCDTKYCALDKEACDEFMKKNETLNINKCIQ